MDPAAILGWLAEPSNWTGSDGIPLRLGEHVVISALSVLVGALVALPVGLTIGHTGRAGVLVIGVANIGRALPSLAIIVGLVPILGLGFGTAAAALVLLAIPPMLTNAYVGVRETDRDLIEAARGMGMREWQILLSLELPVALPVILAGVRTSAVQVVATATMWAIVAGGGLGRYIVDGFALRDIPRLVSGAILVALLAVATELFFIGVARLFVPPGIRAQAVRPGSGGGLATPRPAHP
jgi:osmoprotectant transport system permease protein